MPFASHVNVTTKEDAMKKYRNSELCKCKFTEIEKIISSDSEPVYINLIYFDRNSKESTEHSITECKPYIQKLLTEEEFKAKINK
mgnify:CR=1 FL=1|tara:strand:+ start:46 stop:300 length:255 start_codon:yes stop_codon:yes gene_type:complete